MLENAPMSSGHHLSKLLNNGSLRNPLFGTFGRVLLLPADDAALEGTAEAAMKGSGAWVTGPALALGVGPRLCTLF